MKITVHAGHNPDGKVASGVVGYIKESTAAREVKNEVVRLLGMDTNTKVYDITVDNGTSQSNILTRLVNNANAVGADLNLSIHLNSGVNQKSSDTKTTGTECWIYPESSSQKTAEAICASIANNCGYRNRGVKASKNLYFLKKTNKPSIIVECCFVDDPDDVMIFNAQKIATAIVKAVLGYVPCDVQDPTEDVAASQPGADSTTAATGDLFRVQVGAYRQKANAEDMQKKLKAAGFDAIIVR